jgi:hypothetical protein
MNLPCIHRYHETVETTDGVRYWCKNCGALSSVGTTSVWCPPVSAPDLSVTLKLPGNKLARVVFDADALTAVSNWIERLVRHRIADLVE